MANQPNIPSPKMIIPIAAILLAVVTLYATYFTVDAGKVGVVRRFQEVNRVVDDGLHFKMPFAENVVVMDVRTQKKTTKTEAASKDLQTVQSTIVLNYRLQADKAGEVFRTVGVRYEDIIIDPMVQESFKAEAAKYTAEELITKREKIKTGVREFLKEQLVSRGIIIQELSITDFEFSAEFNKAIEAKQTAEQNALKAKRDLDRIKVEAKQKIASARAEAESLRIQRQVISPNLLKLREIEAQMKAIEKWDGKMPNVTGGAVPFIQVQ
ncbi:MAG TPA: HflC protein [Nitrospiraceae bacterium]|nr:HflC protein [Nitrospiraceae bacterium]